MEGDKLVDSYLSWNPMPLAKELEKNLKYCQIINNIPFLNASNFTSFSSSFVLSEWSQGYCCHFHRTLPLVVNSLNTHPSLQCCLMVFLGNQYPLRGRIFWHRSQWAEIWGRHSLPDLGKDLGMKMRRRLHFHLKSLHHMLWTFARPCTLGEIRLHYRMNRSET